MQGYRRCNRCVMDNHGDHLITFDENGYCNYCTEAITRMNYEYFPNKEGQEKLNNLIQQIKNAGKFKKYDCLMGISGGLDSSYLAMLGSKWGLRILAVHIDDGFDAPVAISNIEKLCNKANLDLQTIKPDSEQFNDLTCSYIKAKVPNLAIPQDNILFAFIYNLMKKHHISYFLSGGNFSLESILQKGNTHTSLDVKNIKAIHDRFGKQPINKLCFISENKRIINRFFYGIKTVRPLNYIDYNKEKAIAELKEFCDFNYYEAKHLENILTKVIQLYWLYHKFGVDKRKSHFSSLIVSGQMTREEALIELDKPLYSNAQMESDIENVLYKLNLTREEFEGLIKGENCQHTDYSYSTNSMLNIVRKFRIVKKLKNKL